MYAHQRDVEGGEQVLGDDCGWANDHFVHVLASKHTARGAIVTASVYVSVCVRVYVCGCMGVCTYVCVYVCKCVRTCLCVSVWVHTYLCQQSALKGCARQV
jgi:hypothetical protein